MNQLTISGKPTKETGTASVMTPATAASPEQSPEKHYTEQYTEEYLLKLIRTDADIFDIRCWQNGITKQEFFKRWNNGFSGSPDADRGGEWWNAGHFAHVLRELKNAGAIDPEVIWQSFLQHKDKHLRELAKLWKRNAEWEVEVAANAITQEECERWQNHAKDSWETMNRCLKELGKPEATTPPGYFSGYPNPLYWGRDGKPGQNNKRTKRKTVGGHK